MSACNCVCEYRAEDVQRYPLSTSAPRQGTDQAPLVVCFQFSCVANNCGVPLKLYVICRQLDKKNPRLRDELAKRLREATFYTKCPNGHHQIQFPASNDFEMT